MPSRYTPEKKTIGQLLSMTNPPILVPEWQRNYSWTTSEVETFWHDLLTFDQLYPENNINDQEYFIGSIVVVDNNVSHLLLDGQQRLATAAILVSVARDYLAHYSKDAATRISARYLTDFDDALNKTTYKLTLNRYDREFFQREVMESRDGGYTEPSISINSHKMVREARKFFTSKFEDEYARIGEPEQAHKWALRVLRVLTNHTSVVAIISVDEDNASTVFETLNDRGIGLSTPDLVRNLILRRAHEDNREEIIDLWGVVLEIEGDARLKAFIRHHWLSREGDVKTQSLYREIKNKVTNENLDSLVFSRELGDSSQTYRDLLAARDSDEEMRQLLAGVNELGASLLYPAIMSGYEVGSTNDLKRLTQALTVAFVRHNVVGGLENSQLESVVYGLAKGLRQNGDYTRAIQALVEIAPDDTRFATSFATASVPRIASARYILKELEYHLRGTEELDVASSNRVHVEHIYPQTPLPGERWSNHAAFINRLGNLTLLSRKLNVTAKNADFATKKPYYEQSEIVLTQKLLPNQDWSAEKIDERQVEMSRIAGDIWTFPQT